jgi:arylamine N-acetyltransferase
MQTDPVLKAYLKRIEYDGPLNASLEVLRSLQEHHATHISFDASAIYLQIPEAMDLQSVHKKLIFEKSGGMCLQQNALFHWVLASLGFKVTMHSARGVGFKEAGKVPLRVHTCLTVALNGETYLVDVGSTQTPLRPVPLSQEESQNTEDVRVIKTNDYWEGNLFQKKAKNSDTWNSIYVFTPEPMHPIDVECMYIVVFKTGANRGRLRNTLIVTRPTPTGRVSIYDNEFSEKVGDHIQKKVITSVDEYVRIMETVFHINVDRESQKLVENLIYRRPQSKL